jgi:hypothetical protein
MCHRNTVKEMSMIHASSNALKYCVGLGACLAIALSTVYIANSAEPSSNESAPQAASVANSTNGSPIYGVTIPPGYREWKMIAVDQLITGKVDQLRAQLGNEIAINAYREGTRPFPDGTIIVALHWNRVPSEDNNKILAGPFPGAQSFVVAARKNMQIMVKDSKKYAATGGWGFADFTDDKPGDKALHETCFPCHAPAKAQDFVFTHYAP